MKRLSFILLMIIAQVARAECPKPTMREAAIIDIGTTLLAIGEHAKEINPLGLAGTTLLKGIVLYNEDEVPDTKKATISAIWTGAGVNNMMAMLGATFYPAMVMGSLLDL